MRAHTRKHHTEKSPIKDDGNGPISAEDYFKEIYGDFPKPAVSLAGLRYREDLTQKQLGELIGVKQSNISMMERGVRPIGKNIAKRLADVFKVDYRIFL